MSEFIIPADDLTPQQFAHLGAGAIAYLRSSARKTLNACSRRRRNSVPACSCSRCSAPTARRSC